jgi:hypothetical protein
MKSLLILAVVSVVLLVQTQGFGGAVPKREARLDVSLPKATFRKVIGSFVVGSAIFGNGMLNTHMENKAFGFGVPTASAAVGEGDLPDGIMAFQKLVKYQKDLDNVADSVKKRGSEMDNMEIQQLKIFMKQLANEYGDMEYLARGISSEKDREAAKAAGKGLREAARAVDKGLSDGKTDILTDNYPAMKKQIADFFALLSDVPDEL